MDQLLAAEEVLNDCELALEFLEVESDRRKFRIFWLAAVAAIRSVGHVLDKVDAKDNPRLKQASNSAFETWKNNKGQYKIFWFFIEDERNTLLKQGEPGIHPLPYQLQVDADFVYECDFDIFAPMLKGPYFGEDCRDVLREAINWWKIELNEIKKSAFI